MNKTDLATIKEAVKESIETSDIKEEHKQEVLHFIDSLFYDLETFKESRYEVYKVRDRRIRNGER